MTSVEALEHRLAALEHEVADLRRQVRGEGAFRPEQRARPASRPPAPTRPVPASPEPVPSAPPPRPPQPAKPRREIDFSRLFGTFGLALAGGVVTVLGIVFLFVLAVNRGWIGPELRLGIGAAISVGLFGTGFWLRSRFGTTHAALAAAGAGIAGGYATLLAATAFYEFVPQIWALVAAAGIAAAATVVALSWREELLAGIGLIGALLVPLMTVVEDGRLTLIGTVFVALVFTATAAVALHERWRILLVAGVVASFAQIAGLVAQTGATDWAVVWLAALFWALYIAVATVEQLASKLRIEPLAATLALAAAALATGSSARLFDGDVGGWRREGLALLVVSAAYLTLGALLLRRERDFSTLLWGIGLTLAGVAAAELLNGAWLAVAWAGEAAVLAWLGETAGERRFRLASAAYLGLALAFTLGHEAPFGDLYELSEHPAAGVPSVLAVAVAVAALVVAWFSRTRPGDRDAGAVAALHRARGGFVWLAGALAVYAASLGLVELFVRLSPASPGAGFERGHVAVTGLWSLVALALVEVGRRLPRLGLAVAGLGLMAFAALKTVGYDHDELAPVRWAVAFLLAAAGALLSGVEYQRLGRRRELRGEAAAAILASALLAIFGILELAGGAWNGIDALGGALVLLALPYAALAAAAFRTAGLRDLATLLWAISLAVGGAALFLLLEGVWLVLALAIASAALSALALLVREPRFQAASALYLLTALAYTLVVEAPPRDFVVADIHPGEGVPSLVLVLLATIAFALCARHERPHERAPFSWSEPITLAGLLGALRSWQASYRLVGYVAAGALGLYALSLAILELAVLVSTAGVDVDFQRGHTAVSASWGAIGLGLLTLGLVRRSRPVRLAGFALYGVSLAKLFLYDLTYSSPLGRPLSFLAVGILLLASGFFYQRLSERMEERDRRGPTPA